jgi:hypothetical protein
VARGGDLLEIMIGFKDFFCLPFVHGTIDVMQVHVYKPKGPFVGDYYSFKLKEHNMRFQVIGNF